MKFMTPEEQEEFWARHRKAREALDKRLTVLPFSEKVKIVKHINADVKSLLRAKKVSENARVTREAA